MIKREMWRVAILVVCSFFLGLADSAWAINAWERWETELTSSDPSLSSNPLKAYRDVGIQATFWRKNGSTCTEPATCTNPDNCFKGQGFWDGSAAEPRKFKIRSAFPSGTWCWKTCRLVDPSALQPVCATTDTGLNKSGEVTVSSATSTTSSLYSNGFLKAPAGKRNLTTWNGQTIFQWIGDTAWNAPINYASSRATWASYVSQRAKGYDGNTFAGGGGFTNILVAPAVQTLANPPSGGFRGFIASGCPTVDRPAVPASCHYWDSAYWRDFEEMIKVANDKGIVIVVADVMDPLNRAGSNQGINPTVLFPTQTDAKIFARNLAARLAGSFVVFSPSYDAKVTDPTAEPGINVAGLIDAVGTAIRAAAPRHLIGVHLAGGSALNDYDQFQSKPWFSLQLFQSGHGGGNCENAANAYANYACRARKFALRFRCIGEPSTNACVGSGAPTGLPKKPAVDIEGQYETLGNNETRVQTRHTAWNSGLSGSFGFNIGVWPDIPRWTNPTAYASPLHFSDDDLGRMKGLFKSMPWSILTPRHDLLVEQNNFSGTTCNHATYGNLSKTDWLQLWKPHLALDTAGGYGLAYLPRPMRCTLSGSVFSPSTSIVLDRTKANVLGISCATWRGDWVSPGSASVPAGFGTVPAACTDSGSGPVRFSVKSSDFVCTDVCDRVLKLTKRTSATSNSPNIAASASTVDLEASIELSDDGQTSKVLGQVLASGLPLGDPVPLSGSDLLFRKLPSVALDASGNFLVVWEEENEAGTNDIVAARFNSLLEPLGPPLLLNDTMDGQQAEPWATGDDSGDTVVAWTSYSEDDVIAGDIYVKVLDRFGQPVGSEILVSTDNEGNQFMPQVQMDGDGGFVVAWTSEPPLENLDVVPPPDESADFSVTKAAPAVRENKSGVYFRVFGADGRPRGPERRVSSGNPGQDRLSRLEVHRHGGFKIRWREFDPTGSDQGEREQEHDQDGNPIGRN